MIVSNLLLIPGNNAVAAEIFQALRYEKTVRLYASQHEKDGDTFRAPHRMTLVGPLPDIDAKSFADELVKTLENLHIDYILPTTDTARAFFATNPDIAPVLTTKADIAPDTVPKPAEWVLDCYSNQAHEPIFVGGRQRDDSDEALWHSKEISAKLQQRAEMLSRKHAMQGPWSVACTQDDVAGDIWPYLTPETALHRQKGVNFSLLMLHEARGNPVSVLPVSAPAKMKALEPAVLSLQLDFKTVFLDLDDTLIIHGAVNDTLMAFVYFCQARDIPVHLITRHYRNPAITLCEFGVAEQLFESVIWIQDGKPKSNFMAEAKEPIFIDDAFSERREVASQTNIPCLSPDVVAGLMARL